MSEVTLKLPAGAEQLLRDFPLTEPDFEAQAKAIEARLKGSPGGVVFDDLLRAPELAAEAGEPAAPSSVRAARAKSNFAEMARKSVQKNEDDGAALAKELLAAAAQNRRPNADMVERVRAAGRAPAGATPLPASEPRRERNSGVVSRAVAAAPLATATATAAASPRPAPRDHRGTIVGVAGVAVAIAACVALYLNTSDSQTRTSAALVAQQAADAPTAAPLKTPAPLPAKDEGVLSPEALAAAPVAATEGTVRPRAKLAAGVAPVPTPSGASTSKQELIELAEDAAPEPAAPVTVPKAEPSPEPPLKPAQGNNGSVPLNPSAGAVSTALSSVRGNAQACLAGQTDAVTAVVTFAADGHVLRVSAGGPSGACIQAALSKAHIAPFAKESFSATTTVRPP